MDDRAQRMADRFELPMIFFSALVIPVMILEAADAGEPWRTLARAGDWAIWLAFLAEAVAMLAVVPDRRRWLLHHPVEVLVIVLTPPFAPPVFQSLRLLRMLRLLRLLRLAPLARYAFSLEGLRYAALVTALAALAGGAAFDQVEAGESFSEGVYLAVNVMTTLGYGTAPDTAAGHAIVVVLVVVGAAFLATLTGAIAQRFLAGGVEAAGEAAGEAIGTEADLARELRSVRERLQALETALQARASAPDDR